MGRLTIEQIIEHCEKTTKQYEEKVSDLFPVERIQPKTYWEHKQVAEYLKELQRYKDLEEQGRLIEQKHGQWEECDWVFYDGHDECVYIPKGAFVCTNCRHAFKKGKLEIRNYCPHCGAKMESEVAE